MGIDFIRNTVTKHRKLYSAEARRTSQDWIAAAEKPIKQVCRAQTYPQEKVAVGEAVLLRRTEKGEVLVTKDARKIGYLAKPTERILTHLKKHSGVAAATIHVVFSGAGSMDIKLE